MVVSGVEEVELIMNKDEYRVVECLLVETARLPRLEQLLLGDEFPMEAVVGGGAG